MTEDADPSARAALQRVGSTVSGRYRLLRVIGIGGMGAVYAGLHRNGFGVAIKILHERLSVDPEIERRFRREAQLANKVQHRGVVPVLDDDVAADGCTFLVMPLLEGQTLRDRWERAARRLPVEEVMAIGHELLSILTAAHAQKIVHRDIKPENIFLTREGELRVLDFGIARFFDVSSPVSMTRSGQAIGTPAYMAPEQALGRLREVDGRTDIWAVGATLFTLLSGHYVHEAETSAEAIVLAATRPARPLSGVAAHVPPPICEVIDRALAFEKSARWADAAAMDRALLSAYESTFGAPMAPLPRAPVSTTGTTSDDVHSLVTEPPPPLREPTAAELRLLREETTAPPTHITGAQPAALDSKPSKRGRALRIAGVVAAMMAAGAATLFATRKPVGVQPPQASASSSAEDRAATIRRHIEAARTAWMDGSVVTSWREDQKALDLDPDSAEANLVFIVNAPPWVEEVTRAHFLTAQAHREQLSSEKREYLEAVAPAMTVPPNFRAAAERLLAIYERGNAPLIVEVGLAQMWMRLGEVEKAFAVLEPLSNGSRAPAIVLAQLGWVQAYREKVQEARDVLTTCTAGYPAAELCSEPLSQLSLNEGDCLTAERLLRAEISAAPTMSSPHLFLAYALDGNGAPPSEIRPVLEKWAALSDPYIRERNKVRVEIRMAMLEGRLRDAKDASTRLGDMMRDVDDDDEQFDYVSYDILIQSEVNDDRAAKARLDQYVASRHELKRNVYGGDNVLYIQGVAASLGIIPWHEWTALRDKRLSMSRDRDELLGGKSRNWLEAYAMPLADIGGDRTAYQEMSSPKYAPLLPGIDRWFWHDAAIGRVYASVGRHAEALPHYQRAARSCARLEDMVDYLRGLESYAVSLEAVGDSQGACDMYKRISSTWPVRSGSRTALRAANRFAARCKLFRPNSQ